MMHKIAIMVMMIQMIKIELQLRKNLRSRANKLHTLGQWFAVEEGKTYGELRRRWPVSTHGSVPSG